ncbi:hypothetical protein KTI59_03820 [Acinetobacter radioresistens]|uniref:hypothetical protein n=1 Tax=Acinetobacter radioresistens TaxID=40216 RepID=UPI0021CD8200|nr:hypothetical protein [Acinetobacter radioresistens]MCU4499252.1 hypothetical protein [Acinetobacter radioresistens]
MTLNKKEIDKIESHIFGNFDAINVLIRHNYLIQAVSLLMTHIDQMSWLSIEDFCSKSNNFKDWLNKYCDFNKYNLTCSSEELWMFRSSAIHMGTAINKKYKNCETKPHAQLAFYYADYDYPNLQEESENITKGYNTPTKHVNLKHLIDCTKQGTDIFKNEIYSSEFISSGLQNKLSYILTVEVEDL